MTEHPHQAKTEERMEARRVIEEGEPHRKVSPAVPWLVAAFCVLVTVSGLQLYLQETTAGRSTPFLSVFVANLIASLPWLPLAVGILWLSRRIHPLQARGMLFHAASSISLGAIFLSWLALFHLFVSGGPFTFDHYLSWLREDLIEFFTLTLIIYWLIVLVGLAIEALSALAIERAGWREMSRKLTDSKRAVEKPPFLVIRSVGRSRVVDPAEIDWIEADGSYVRLHVGPKSHLLRRSLGALAEELAGAGFARVHRSSVVNLARVAELRPLSHGEALLVLHGGQELKVSRTFRKALDPLGL